MKNIVLLLVSMFVLSLLSIGIANADIECNATITTGELNITYNSSDGVWDRVFAAINVSSAKTANSSQSFLGNFSNTTNRLFVNVTLGNSIVVEDSNDYVVRGFCYGTKGGATGGGGQNQSLITSASGVTIDRTTPNIPTTSHAAETEFEDAGIITYAVGGVNTTSCRIAFGKTLFTGSNTFAMVHSGNTCKYTVSKATIPDGTYKTYVRASDETNTSISVGRDFKIKTLEGVASDDIASLSVPIIQKAVAEKVNLGMVVLIIIFGAFVYMAFFKKK